MIYLDSLGGIELGNVTLDVRGGLGGDGEAFVGGPNIQYESGSGGGGSGGTVFLRGEALFGNAGALDMIQLSGGPGGQVGRDGGEGAPGHAHFDFVSGQLSNDASMSRSPALEMPASPVVTDDSLSLAVVAGTTVPDAGGARLLHESTFRVVSWSSSGTSGFLQPGLNEVCAFSILPTSYESIAIAHEQKRC